MYNSFDFINSPVFDTLKRLQTDMNTNSVLAELKRTIDSTNVLKDIIPRITSPFSEINEIKNIIPNYVTSLATYQPFITSLSPVLHNNILQFLLNRLFLNLIAFWIRHLKILDTLTFYL